MINPLHHHACSGCLEKSNRIAELEGYMKEIIAIQPLDVFGPMSDRMREVARKALEEKSNG